MKQISIEFTINSRLIQLKTNPNRTLLEVLRDDLGLTGAKDACGGEGECGACTVLLDGNPINACLVLIGQVKHSQIVTIEGLSAEGLMHPIQKAFIEAGAIQCGFCTPGMVLASKALLDRDPNPDETAIREALSGNLCRCTGYTKIIQAVRQAAVEINHVQ
jgi:aerobic-type carbon monoxide dehydrogenase small subunit (CoxS/CutS family)